MARVPFAIEQKNLTFEVKSIDEDLGIVTGYLSVFGNVDYQKDRVLKGAFRKTIQDGRERKTNRGKKYLWPVLWMHDADKPIGGFTDAQEDEKGLLVSAQLDISTNSAGVPNNPLATLVFSGYKAGYIDEFSIGYNILQKDYDEAGVRNLKEVRIVEGSAVTMLFAANAEAQATGVKSMTNQKSFLERYNAVRTEQWMQDDFQALSYALKYATLDMLVGDQNVDVETLITDFATAYRDWVNTGMALGVQDMYKSNPLAAQESKEISHEPPAQKALDVQPDAESTDDGLQGLEAFLRQWKATV